MKHRLKHRKLNRTSSHRGALFFNMSCSLIDKEIIKTTVPKAKELRPYIERLITKASKYDQSPLPIRRYLLSKFRNNEIIVDKLISNLGNRFKSRPGGYCRVVKCGYRRGDAAPMAFLELLDRDLSLENISTVSPSYNEVVDTLDSKNVNTINETINSSVNKSNVIDAVNNDSELSDSINHNVQDSDIREEVNNNNQDENTKS